MGMVGRHTRHGGFVVDWKKVRTYVISDLMDFAVYLSYGVSRFLSCKANFFSLLFIVDSIRFKEPSRGIPKVHLGGFVLAKVEKKRLGSINLTYHRWCGYISVGCTKYNRFYGFPFESQHCTYNISVVHINLCSPLHSFRYRLVVVGRILMCIGVGLSLPR